MLKAFFQYKRWVAQENGSGHANCHLVFDLHGHKNRKKKKRKRRRGGRKKESNWTGHCWEMAGVEGVKAKRKRERERERERGALMQSKHRKKITQRAELIAKSK